jgi:hypothetical protein
MKLKRVTALGLAALAAGIVSVLLATSQAPSANALPSVPATVAKKLRRGYEIYLRSLPAGYRPRVSQSAAEATALKEFGRPVTSKVSAFAVSDTDKELSQRQPDGKMPREYTNRFVWVVLLPNFSMMGYRGMTLCVFVDAKTGKYLYGSTLWLRRGL